jgi:oxygen-independent coproporphyrinogen-3 oxidase
MFYNKEMVSRYLTALEKEIKEFYMGEIVHTIYIGGGSPSSLSYDELDKLFEIINLIKKDENCEFTFECNPEDIDDVLINKLSLNGVNRISMGVQSFNNDNLKFMERSANFDDIKNKIRLIRYYGINNINLDLMYGLPGETLDIVKKDVKLFLKLAPEHISTYSLIIEDHTKIKISGAKNIDEDEEVKMYEYICKKLKQKGYNHYEVSNFALNDNYSRHNLSYWNNEEYYGFGLGAAGYMNGFRYENTRNLNKYEIGEYRQNESLLSKQEIMEYEVMLGLRKMKGINLAEFYQKFNVNMQDAFPVKPLVKSKELLYKNGNILINPTKIYVMNEILSKLI